MRARPIDQIVYEHIFPRPKANDPVNFAAFVQRNIIPEVRLETQAFYGHIETQEAKYPGLDYNHATHRIRLRRFPGHRLLFKAFDRISLTPCEIDSLTKWEGTKWAKTKYEREQGVVIRDTTLDDTPTWDEVQADKVLNERRRRAQTASARRETAEGEDDAVDGEESEDDELVSVGVALNQRLREQVARRDAGESVVMDEEWEQWFKNAFERGELVDIGMDDNGAPLIPAELMPHNMLSTARAGQWSEIPELFHERLRDILIGEDRHAAREGPIVDQLRPAVADEDDAFASSSPDVVPSAGPEQRDREAGIREFASYLIAHRHDRVNADDDEYRALVARILPNPADVDTEAPRSQPRPRRSERGGARISNSVPAPVDGVSLATRVNFQARQRGAENLRPLPPHVRHRGALVWSADIDTGVSRGQTRTRPSESGGVRVSNSVPSPADVAPLVTSEDFAARRRHAERLLSLPPHLRQRAAARGT